jgi:hypothetical protein
MKRSTTIAIIVILLCIAIGGVLGFYFYLNGKSTQLDKFGKEAVTSSNFGSSLNTSVKVPGNSSTTQQVRPPELQQQLATTTVREYIPILRQIYGFPVAGMDFFKKDLFATTTAVTETIFVANGTTTASTTRILKPAVRRLVATIETMEFMDRGNAHMYETSSTTLANYKISNTTFTKIQEAFFTSKDSILMRDLQNDSDTIRTRFGIQKLVNATSTARELVLQNLPYNIQSIALSPDKSKVFYTQKSTPTGMISNVDGKSTVQAFDSPFKEWLVQWPTPQTLIINTKPSANIDGFAYKIDVNSKNMQKLMGNIKGLTTLMSPDGEKIAYSKSDQGSPNLYSLEVKTGKVTNLYMRTLPEKCAWSRKDKDILICGVPEDLAIGDYPDVWYQGRIFFNDSLWKINTRTGETRLLARLYILGGESLDVINPVLNPTEDYLMFMNKADLSLWGLRLANYQTANATSTATSTATTAPRSAARTATSSSSDK